MIKTYIKTAHGYISFQPAPQPDGRIELQYRDSPGLWEEITLETLEAPIAPPEPESPPVEPPATGGAPASVNPIERTPAYIGRVKSYLQSQGYNLTGPCGAFCIVEHAVWWLAPTNPTVGLLDKPEGNMCRSYATDIIFFRDQRGAIVDVLGDGGNANNPQWNVSNPGEAELERWRPPVVPAGKMAVAAASVAKAHPSVTPTKKR
jgi:hypothetical protein